jgi:hypothetical protein
VLVPEMNRRNAMLTFGIGAIAAEMLVDWVRVF